jgi:hypothetical protein
MSSGSILEPSHFVEYDPKLAVYGTSARALQETRECSGPLFEAGDRAALDAKLLDPEWLQAKLTATTSPLALASDYERFGQSRMQNLIGRTLRLTAGICAREPHQLVPRLLGRLSPRASDDLAAPAFLAAARRHVSVPAILTQRASLTSPAAETTRLKGGHVGLVNALAVVPDGPRRRRPHNSALDLVRGTETARLEIDVAVICLAALPDGSLVAGDMVGGLHWPLIAE